MDNDSLSTTIIPQSTLEGGERRGRKTKYWMDSDSLSTTILQDTLVGATPWSAEEMLGGNLQRVDISAHARTAHNGVPPPPTHTQKLEGGSVLNRPSCPPDDPIGQVTELN